MDLDRHQPSRARLRFARRLPQTAKNNTLVATSEFIGTFFFLLLALTATNAVNNTGYPTDNEPLAANPAKLLLISTAFGLSLAVAVSIFFRLSGGMLNPAVTVGLVVTGAVGPVRGVLAIFAQLLGGMAASALLLVLLPGELIVGTTLGPYVSVAQGLFIEFFLTTFLVLTVLALANQKHKTTFLEPVAIGLALFAAEIAGIPYTGGSLNPARSLGPCVATWGFPGYHWIYWVGPLAGGVVAGGFHRALKILEGETVNPGQSVDGSGGGRLDKDEGVYEVGCERGKAKRPMDVEARGGGDGGKTVQTEKIEITGSSNS